MNVFCGFSGFWRKSEIALLQSMLSSPVGEDHHGEGGGEGRREHSSKCPTGVDKRKIQERGGSRESLQTSKLFLKHCLPSSTSRKGVRAPTAPLLHLEPVMKSVPLDHAPPKIHTIPGAQVSGFPTTWGLEETRTREEESSETQARGEGKCRVFC